MNTPQPEFARGVSPESTTTLPEQWAYLRRGIVLFQHRPRSEPDPILSIGKWAENRGLVDIGHVFRVWRPVERSQAEMYAWALYQDFYLGCPNGKGLPPEDCYYFKCSKALAEWKRTDYGIANRPPMARWHVLTNLWHPNGARAGGHLFVLDRNYG